MSKCVSCFLIILLLLQIESRAQDISFESSKSELKNAAFDYYSKGNEAFNKTQYELAKVYYDTAIRINGEESDYFLARGQSKELTGNEIGALEDYHEALKRNKYNSPAHFKRALIFLKRGNNKQAIKDLTYLINNVENYETPVLIFKGRIHTSEESDNNLSSIYTLDEFKADMYEHRALAYKNMGFNTPTLLDYDKAIEYNKYDPNYYVNRGMFKLDLGDKEGAISDYRLALKINKYHRAALYNLSFLVEVAEKDEINKILYGHGDKAISYSKRAFEYFQKGLYDKALASYDSALVLKSDNANDLMNRGIVKAKVGDHKNAIKDFKASVFHDNTLIRNYVLTGNSYQTLENYPYAIDYYLRYLDHAGPDASVLYSLGLTYMKYHNDDQACITFRKAIELGDERAEAPMDKVCF